MLLLTRLFAYRRHSANCPHAAKGGNFTGCQCPVWCDGKLEGKRFRRSLDTADWARAERRLAKIARGEEVDFLEAASEGRTVGACTKAFLDECAARHLKPGSLIAYGNVMKQLDAMWGKTAIAALTPERISQFRDRKKAKPRTQRKEIEYLRAFCSFCIDRGWIEKNPAKSIRPPRVEDAATLPFSNAEVRSLLEACGKMQAMWTSETPEVRKRAKALLLTLLYSGLRIGDVAQLRRDALDPNGYLTLRIMKTGVPLKLALNAGAAEALRALPAPGGNPTYFFWSGRGKVKKCSFSLWRTVHRVGELANIRAHPHRFRDTFAVELLTQGADIRTVQMLLGHESIRTTERHYAHFVPAHQQRLDSAVATLSFGLDDKSANRPLAVSRLRNRRRNP